MLEFSCTFILAFTFCNCINLQPSQSIGSITHVYKPFIECFTLRKTSHFLRCYGEMALNLTIYLTANKSESIFIFFCFSSIDGWTYRFNVIFTDACPKISLRLFISNPSSMHLVANVCLRAWKFAGAIPAFLIVDLNLFCMVRGST